MNEKAVIRINEQGPKYDVKSLAMQSIAYPDFAIEHTELVENKPEVYIDKDLPKPVIIVHEGQTVLLMANKPLESIVADRLKAGRTKIVCKLANKYVLKKALVIEPSPRTSYQGQREARPYQAPRRYSQDAGFARNHYDEYNY